MARYNGEHIESTEAEKGEVERNELESNKECKAHFDTTYSLKPNEKYEANHYSYETDRYGRIKHAEGSLRLEDGKRNPAHQVKAGGEYRLEHDEGGHLIGTRFGGSEKVDNIVPMDFDVNRREYKEIENEWEDELGKGSKVDVKIRCKYEEESSRPTAFIVKYRVTEPDGFVRNETKAIENPKSGGDPNERHS